MDNKLTKILKSIFIIMSFLIVNILIDGLTGALVPPLVMSLVDKPTGNPMDYMVYGLLAGQIVKAIILYFLIRKRKNRFVQKYQSQYIKSDRLEKPIRFVGLGLGTVGFGLILTNLIMKVLDGTPILDNAMRLMENAFSAQNTLQGMIILLVIIIGAPFVEELLFRGVLFEELNRVVSTKTTIILTALIFALYHFNILQTPNTFFMGLILAYVYYNTRSIKAPIIVHLTNNLLATMPFIDQGFTPMGFAIYIGFLAIGIYSLSTLRK